MLLGRYMPLGKVAVVIGVPANFLEALAADGQVPHLTAGRQALGDPRIIKRELDRIAAKSAGQAGKPNR